MKLIRWIDLVRESQHGVFEGEQCPRIDVKFDVQIDGTTAAILGMKVDLPRLSQ
jgi:hypothetical protein